MAKATKSQINRSQRTRFIKAAREAGCSEDEVVFDRNLKRVAKAKPAPKLTEVRMAQNETWEQAILKAYLAASGCADNDKIYRTIGDFIPLTSAHERATIYGGRPAYHHQVRSYISNLTQAGYLEKRGRGHYCLTDRGKERATT